MFSWGALTIYKNVFLHNLIKNNIFLNENMNNEQNIKWTKKLVKGDYILHFRHAQREKWNDVTAFDAYEY
tara:strand:+ start:132 stop:341 length:210 start_codon:yes stop_codon:yes gene_type:complete